MRAKATAKRFRPRPGYNMNPIIPGLAYVPPKERGPDFNPELIIAQREALWYNTNGHPDLAARRIQDVQNIIIKREAKWNGMAASINPEVRREVQQRLDRAYVIAKAFHAQGQFEFKERILKETYARIKEITPDFHKWQSLPNQDTRRKIAEKEAAWYIEAGRPGLAEMRMELFRWCITK